VSREQTLIESLINVTFYVQLKVCNCTKRARSRKSLPILSYAADSTFVCSFITFFLESKSTRVWE